MTATFAQQQQSLTEKVVAEALAKVRQGGIDHEVAARVYSVTAEAVEAASDDTARRLYQLCGEAVEAFHGRRNA